MKLTKYHDTRGLDPVTRTFTETIVAGIAPGGGLYVPEELPHLTLDDILAIESWPYWRRAAAVYSRFGVDLPDGRIDELMQEAYGSQFDDDRIAPIEEVVPGTWVLELWHGPTSAFKDMALQCLPLFFSEALEGLAEKGQDTGDYLILVATSGDTGKAALEGFSDREHTNILVFYPADGVSDIQRKQMVTQAGDNVGVFGVRGNFDDCQAAVKAAFDDQAFRAELASQHGLQLSSANSINWGRLLPQVVYYVSAYADMVAAGGVVAGEPMDVCVPTGNFGNVLGAYYARRMGVPIGRLIVAANENNVLADFVATGLYDISDRQFVTTPSPSMDILLSSNLERLLFELTADASLVRGWMDSLDATGLRVSQILADPQPVLWLLRQQQRISSTRSERSLPRRATCSIPTRLSPGKSPSGFANATPCLSSRRRTGLSSAPTSTRLSPSCPTPTCFPTVSVSCPESSS